MRTPGELLRQARHRHGVTQTELAIRASTTQSAISRIERNQVSPSVEALGELLFLLGEDLVLEARPRESNVDRAQLRERLAMTVDERIERGLTLANQVIEAESAGKTIPTTS